jgi:hypothetical protein
MERVGGKDSFARSQTNFMYYMEIPLDHQFETNPISLKFPQTQFRKWSNFNINEKLKKEEATINDTHFISMSVSKTVEPCSEYHRGSWKKQNEAGVPTHQRPEVDTVLISRSYRWILLEEGRDPRRSNRNRLTLEATVRVMVIHRSIRYRRRTEHGNEKIFITKYTQLQPKPHNYSLCQVYKECTPNYTIESN